MFTSAMRCAMHTPPISRRPLTPLSPPSPASLLRYIAREDIGDAIVHGGSNGRFEAGGRKREVRLFQDPTPIGGHDGRLFPPTLDMWGLFGPALPATFPVWSDQTYRVYNIDQGHAEGKRDWGDALARRYGAEGTPGGLNVAGGAGPDVSYDVPGTIRTVALKRYGFGVDSLPRTRSDLFTPECMVNMRPLLGDLPIFLGTPMYRGCSPELYSGLGIRGVPPAVRVGMAGFRDFPNYVDVEPYTGRAWRSSRYATQYVDQQFRAYFFETGVAPVMLPYVSVHEHAYHLSVAEMAAFAVGIHDARVLQVGAVLGFLLGALIFCVTGNVLLTKGRKKWKKMQLVYPEDDYEMRLEVRTQVITEEVLAEAKVARVVFKAKTVTVRKARVRREAALAKAQKKLHDANEFELEAIDAACEVDEKGDIVMPTFGRADAEELAKRLEAAKKAGIAV
jgi:hypothetical protein